MDGSPQKYHFSFRLNKQDGRHRRLFWLAEFQIFFFLKFWIDFHKTMQEWLLDGLQQKYKFSFRLINKMAAKWIILIGRFSNIFFSETTGPNLTKLCRNDVWMILYKNTTFRSGWKKQRWPPRPILDFNWPIFKNLLLCNYSDRIYPNFTGVMCGGPSQKKHTFGSCWMNNMAARANSQGTTTFPCPVKLTATIWSWMMKVVFIPLSFQWWFNVIANKLSHHNE